jgi:hypothetical protein
VAAAVETRDDWIAAADEVLLRQCEVDRYRASGPGGQHRNKTESAVRLRHASGVVAHSTDSRSQHENKTRAVRRLRENLAFELRLPVDLTTWTAPAPLAALAAEGLGKRGEKTRVSVPYLLAVAALLDLFAAYGGSVSETAARIGHSTGALSRFFLADDRLTRAVGTLRAAHGLKPLR